MNELLVNKLLAVGGGLTVLIGSVFMLRRKRKSKLVITETGESVETDLDLSGTLGFNNNNPMNVRDTNIDWLGELESNGTGYEHFESDLHGLRAGARVLSNYEEIHGLDNLTDIIGRYAPHDDNNPTTEYIDFVAKRLVLSADESFSVKKRLLDLMKAIIHFENGEQPYADALIELAITEQLK